ncbi:MAG: DUF234 domain-containing protein [Solirubrobacteraceae bacterium]
MPTVPNYSWPLYREFLNRSAELSQLERWWASGDRMIVNLYGRRRVGKSWLFRAFAHGKPAIVLVAEQVARNTQLSRFAGQLEPHLGLRPEIPDVPELFRLLYRIARSNRRRTLAVIDELPYLLPTRPADRQAMLTSIQAVIEEELDSPLKLVVCGSHVSQMEQLLTERNPLRGRLRALPVEPMTFTEAKPFLERLPAEEQITRFSIAGGMPRYLSDLAAGPSLRDLVCNNVLDRHSALFDEPREILEQEFRDPRVYFSILLALSDGDKPLDQIVTVVGEPGAKVNKYLTALQEMRIVEQRKPVTAGAASRGALYSLVDPFFRFWFRFVFPYQDSLSTGLQPAGLYDSIITNSLASHTAPVFEQLARAWVLREHGRSSVQRAGAWWGNSLNNLRRTGERTTEEIDVVGMSQSQVTLVGEAKWTASKLGLSVLTDLEKYKIPAVRQGAKVAASPRIALFSKSGFGTRLQQEAASRADIQLIGAQDLVSALQH